MPTYAFEAMNSSGQEVKDEIEAATSDDAIKKIRSKGFFPTKVKEKAAKKSVRKKKEEETSLTPKRKMPLSIGGVPRKQLVSFTRQLSTLQDAGLPILRSLQILEQQQKPGLLKAIIGGVADEVEGGGTLSDAMSKYPKAFDKLYVNMIRSDPGAAAEAGPAQGDHRRRGRRGRGRRHPVRRHEQVPQGVRQALRQYDPIGSWSSSRSRACSRRSSAAWPTRSRAAAPCPTP